MSGYTKLFGSIIHSTIWREDNATRIVWVTLLAMSDRHGVVECSVPGLADMARVSVEDCRVALAKLMAPDPDSRSKDCEGRRIVEVDGGFEIVNRSKYREKLSEDERREYKRDWQARRRARGQSVDSVDTCGQELSTAARADSDSQETTAQPAPVSHCNGKAVDTCGQVRTGEDSSVDVSVDTCGQMRTLLTQTETETESKAESESKANTKARSKPCAKKALAPGETLPDSPKVAKPPRIETPKGDPRFQPFVDALQKYWRHTNKAVEFDFSPRDGKALNNLLDARPNLTEEAFKFCLNNRVKSRAINHSNPIYLWIERVTETGNGAIDRYNKPEGVGSKADEIRAANARAAEQALAALGISESDRELIREGNGPRPTGVVGASPHGLSARTGEDGPGSPHGK